MSKLAKIALILAIAVLVIGATHIVSPPLDLAADDAPPPSAQVSPAELKRDACRLPVQSIESLEFVSP